MKLKPGDIAQVTFLDHCEGGDDLLECTVWGRVVTHNKRRTSIRGWEADEDNETVWNIYTPAITQIKKLK